MEERKFNVGDKITYKSRKDCGDSYEYGGLEQGGFVGEVRSYGSYIEKFNCYRISVTCKDGGSYDMLESEFEEYDHATSKEPTYEIF